MNKGGFSWKRFVGISGAKARVGRKIRIPLTRSGRHQKIGRAATGGGCLLVLSLLTIVIVSVWATRHRR
jgi:hypothetical protein